ncbi:hypothetical protein RJ639_026640 [Escallonia herrerae]|uniref:Uncharacterized protein n=1 Tax=Escallonia herrerae TaxID=1293975 RepID=A0AA89ABT5_9ASTE|nr:hypothetical protein RJ639_026640 [Escallonia herrerae]
MATEMLFYLTTLNLARFLQEDAPNLGENPDRQTVAAVDAWKHSDFLCKNYILNGLDNALYNVYSPMVNAKALWESLERKYKTEDAGSKKFVVGKFLDFKMVDSKTVISQVQEFQLILHDIHAEGMVLGESFQVAALIEKLPPTWKDFKNYLKHKRKEMKLEDLIVRLRIEEDNRQSEKKAGNYHQEAKANVVEQEMHPPVVLVRRVCRRVCKFGVLLFSDNDLSGSNSRMQRQQSLQVPINAEYISVLFPDTDQTNSMEMSNPGGMLYSHNSNGKEFSKMPEENPSAGQLLRHLDPWISPYRVRKGIFQLLDEANGTSANQAPGTSNAPMTSLPTMHTSGTSSEANLQANIQSQQPSVVYDQSPPTLLNPQPGAMGNTPTMNNLKDVTLPVNYVDSSQEQSSSLLDGNYYASQSLRAFQSPSLERTSSPLANTPPFTTSTSTVKLQAVSEVPQPKEKRKVMSEYLNPNTTFLSLMNAAPLWQLSVDFSDRSNSYNDHSRDNNDNNNWGGEGRGDDNHLAAPEQDAWEEQTFWIEGSRDTGLWEWDDLSLAGMLNLEDLDFFSK